MKSVIFVVKLIHDANIVHTGVSSVTKPDDPRNNVIDRLFDIEIDDFIVTSGEINSTSVVKFSLRR